MKFDWLVVRSQALHISFRIEPRVPKVLLILAIATFVVMLINVSIGEYYIAPLDVLETIFRQSNPEYTFVVNTLRLPRTLVALMVGVALAISGCIFQGLTRNPLADPGIVGINAGASLAAVIVIVLLGSSSLVHLPVAAFAGAVIVALLIFLLAGQGTSIRLILVGVGIAAITSALTTLFITFGEINTVSEALIWLVGSVYGRTWEHVLSMLPWLIVFVPLALMLARDLNTLNLGDDLARGLGNQVECQRALLLLVSVALAGAAVATAGTISFVGLIAPHIGRQLVGSTHENLIPVSAVIGALIVVLADLCGRILFAPIELPCGVITASIGAPYFVYLLLRNRVRSHLN